MTPVTKSFPRAAAIACGIAVLAGGCAEVPKDDPAALEAYREANDPLEPMNRAFLEFNLFLDRMFLKPVAFVYKETIPADGRRSVRNFLGNLRSPVILANDLFQGEFDRAGNTIMRFTINSTIGLGGLLDVAQELGYRSHEEDFGQTLAVYGAGEGPYLMLPIFGPSNPRDALGLIVDIFLDPFSYLFNSADVDWASPARFTTSAVDIRAQRYDQINSLQRESLDFYATLRSLYRQRRADEIRNGRPSGIDPSPRLTHEVPPEPSSASSVELPGSR